jgi:replicative DNA helicase
MGKQLPASLEAEKAVLGALLLNDEYLARVSEFLLADDFFNPAHKIIYQTIVNLSQQLKRIDLVTLQDELLKREQLEAVGGIIYLISLQEDYPVVGFIEQHARIIKEKATLRQLIESANGILAKCYGQDEQGIEVVLDEAEKTIFQISNKRTEKSFTQIDIWLKKTFQHLSDVKSHAKGITGIPSGYKKFDQMTSGLQSGDLIVLAARPSMGKTALALNIASASAEAGFCVGIFSLEMGAEQLTLRLLSAVSEISHHKIRNADLTSDEWVSITGAAAKLSENKIFIDDAAMLDIMELRAKARKLKIEHNVQLLIVDYLQLIHTVKKHENRHQEVSEISRSLKGLAKELDVPIIALSQLSRAVDARMDKRPMLSDLRESGAIEQDADVIMFLYRDSVYNPDTENPASAELIIGKQRNGPTGTVFLNFVKELTKFEDSDDEF